jgi:hypothetical protein
MIDLYNTLLDVRARSAEADRRIGLSHAMGGSGRPCGRTGGAAIAPPKIRSRLPVGKPLAYLFTNGIQ